ncbi:hypothetical protein DSB67_08045 [Vibrio campbellii]|nr:hypothetical protein DSB67_08045 [Vibrio campbellii]
MNLILGFVGKTHAPKMCRAFDLSKNGTEPIKDNLSVLITSRKRKRQTTFTLIQFRYVKPIISHPLQFITNSLERKIDCLNTQRQPNRLAALNLF